jgi:hypothetical protein
MLLSQWSGDYDFTAHEKLVRSFFPPSTAKVVLDSKRVAFHRRQLLYVAQEAMRICNEDGRQATGPYWGGFGVVLLMASDLLYVPLPQGANPSAEWARKICQILPDMEANGLKDYETKIARSLAIYSRFIEPFRGTPNFYDVQALFEEAAGLPLETFQALLFGCVARFANLSKLKGSSNPADFAIGDGWFSKTTVPPEQISSFFNMVSADSAGYATDVAINNPRPNDFKVLSDKPLFRDGQNYFPIDLSLLTDKFDSGPFWKVNGHIPGPQRERFHVFWGQVFEAYIQWLLGSSVDGKTNRLLPNPTYSATPEQEVCDAIVIAGRCAVLIEIKSSTFTVASKYGDDPGLLDTELQGKLVGTAARRKGVYQLADAVQRICKPNSQEHINGLDPYEITTFFPLILLRDDLGSAFGMNAYLNYHFQELIKGTKFQRAVTPVFCMSSQDLEKLSPYLHDTPLATILSARYKSDKDLAFSFWATENTVLSKKGPRSPTVLARETEQLVQLAQSRLGLEDEVES